MSGGLVLRPSSECRFDVVVLGEVMLRLDPGEDRVRTARAFRVSEGGGEYNVGRALRRCFGRSVALVTALGDNEVAGLLADLLLQGGLNLDHVVVRHSDELGRANRTPLNFTERGFGVRGARGVYDRAHSAAASLRPDDVDWDRLFGSLGARWLHTGGIFAGLSDASLETTRAAMASARRHGTVVSYDVNYRPSLWAAAGGAEAAERLTEELSSAVDVLLGTDSASFAERVERLARTPSGPDVLAAAIRTERSASFNDWGGLGWSRTDGIVEGSLHERLEVLDRVGGGDGFAAGVIHGLLGGEPLAGCLELGTALGALTMTTRGDTAAADEAEVRRLAAGIGPSTTR